MNEHLCKQIVNVDIDTNFIRVTLNNLKTCKNILVNVKHNWPKPGSVVIYQSTPEFMVNQFEFHSVPDSFYKSAAPCGNDVTRREEPSLSRDPLWQGLCVNEEGSLRNRIAFIYHKMDKVK